MNNRSAVPPRKSDRRLAAWLLLLIGLVVFALVGNVADFARRPAAPAATAPPPAPAMNVQALADAPEPAAEPQPALHAAAAPQPMAARPRRLNPGEAELCGVGVVRVDEDDPQGRRQIPESVRALALERLGRSMAASDDVQVRAADLLLRARLATDADALARVAEEDAACRSAQRIGLQETGQFCTGALGQSEAALLEPAAPAVDALARLAAVSRDPTVYAMAFDACHGGGLSYRASEGSCQLVSADEWSRIEPANAVPWLHLAAQAMARGDAEAADAAMASAAQAGLSDNRATALPGLVLGAVSNDMPSIERTAVTAEVLALPARRAEPAQDTVAAYCADTALRDAARSHTCEAMAGMLLNRGRSPADTLAGVQLAERLGWPAERTHALMLRQQAAFDAANGFAAHNSPLSCEGLQRARAVAMLAARHGLQGRPADGPAKPDPWRVAR